MIKIAKQDDIRDKLEKKVFAVIGKSVTLISKSAPIYNTRGDLESYTSASSTITIVPYNIVNDERLFDAWGNTEEGEYDAAIPYTVTIAIDDEITMEGENWKVQRREENYLPDNIVTIVRMTKVQN